MVGELGLFESMDVVLPPRPRPKSSDRFVQVTAATTFAAQTVKSDASLIDDTPEDEFRDQVLSVLPIYDHDGMQMAEAMNRRHRYTIDLPFIELMAGWSDHLHRATSDHVRTWVRETRPEAPFEAIARVEYAREHDPERLVGVAYRSDGYDQQARCLVVPDGERDRFVRDGAFSGGAVIDWERVTVTGPATEDERTCYQASLDAEARSARRREYDSFSHKRDKAFGESLEAFAKSLRGETAQTLRVHLSDALARAARDSTAPGFDPFSDVVIEVAALMQVLRVRTNRDAFDRMVPG